MMLLKPILLGILDKTYSISQWLNFLLIITLIVLVLVWIIRKISGKSGKRNTAPLPAGPSSTNEDDVNIAGGWSGRVSEPKSSPTGNYGITKKGRIILRGVVQRGAGGMRIQVYDNDDLKQVEVKAGRWANGIREGDIIRLLGRWRNKAYVKASRIHNETTGVDFKPLNLVAIILIVVIVFTLFIIAVQSIH